jgi:HEAT repeat protein
MGSYIASFVVAGTVVACLLGLLTFTQEGKIETIQDSVAQLNSDALLKMTESDDVDKKIEAILRLGEQPGDLSVTVPALANLALDMNELVRMASTTALQEIGGPGIPHLRSMMESGDDVRIVMACSAAKVMGPDGKVYLPLYREWLGSEKSGVRKRALYALQGLGSEAAAVVDELVVALDDAEFNNQCMACRVLERLGADAIPAEETLLRLLEEGNPSVQGWSAIVLGAIGPTDKTETAEVLRNKLTAFANVVKLRALLGLAHMGPEAKSVEEDVRAIMNDKSKHAQPHAAYALYRITGKADESIKMFKQLVEEMNTREDTLELLGKMQGDAAPMVDQLLPFLESEEDNVRESTVITLGNIGPAAKSAIGKLTIVLSDKDPMIRYAAKKAIEQINATDD